MGESPVIDGIERPRRPAGKGAIWRALLHFEAAATNPHLRHGRACPGHPRLVCVEHCKKVVDARHKAGHDGIK
jgi:hypothetical protein